MRVRRVRHRRDQEAERDARRRRQGSPPPFADQNRKRPAHLAARVIRVDLIEHVDEIVVHLVGVLVPIRRVLDERAVEYAAKRFGRARQHVAQRRVRHIQDVVHDRAGVVGQKRRRAGQHFVQDRAEREDVGARIGALSPNLFRRHVENGSGRVPAFRDGCFVEKRGETEVDDLHHGVTREHQVRGFDVAMDHAAGVCVCQTIGDGRGDGERFDDRKGALLQAVAEGGSIAERHRKKQPPFGGRSHVIEAADVGMFERRHRFRAAEKAAASVGVREQIVGQELECDREFQLRMGRPIDDTGRTGTDFRDDVIVGDVVSDHGGMKGVPSFPRFRRG